MSFRYYRNWRFCLFDMFFLFSYLFFNPFRISKVFLEKKGDNNCHIYGETPLTTWEKIVKKCGILASDRILELGAGRSRLAFWSHFFIGAKSVSVEQVPFFVTMANFLKNFFHIKNMKILQQDFLNIDFENNSVVYLYGSCLEDEVIDQLIEKMKTMTKGTKIITISYPLTDYVENIFSLEKSFDVVFPWGTTTAYFQIKR